MTSDLNHQNKIRARLQIAIGKSKGVGNAGRYDDALQGMPSVIQSQVECVSVCDFYVCVCVCVCTCVYVRVSGY